MHEESRRRKQRPRRKLKTLLFVMVLLAVAMIAGRFFFSVRAIEVKGNHIRSSEEVIEAAGIALGDFIITIKPEEVRERIDANRYLQFVSIWKRYTSGTVVITVSEQMPYAKLMWMGHLVLLGPGGVVLENNHLIDTMVHVPEIIGMSVDRARIGDKVTYKVVGQGEAINEIIDALYAQGIAGDIQGINVALTDNLAMMTHSGLEIILGDSDNLSAKVELVRDVLPRIQAEGTVSGGSLTVSSGIWADYDPP